MSLSETLPSLQHFNPQLSLIVLERLRRFLQHPALAIPFRSAASKRIAQFGDSPMSCDEDRLGVRRFDDAERRIAERNPASVAARHSAKAAPPDSTPQSPRWNVEIRLS